jgi:hypothetical protein
MDISPLKRSFPRKYLAQPIPIVWLTLFYREEKVVFNRFLELEERGHPHLNLTAYAHLGYRGRDYLVDQLSLYCSWY